MFRLQLDESTRLERFEEKHAGELFRLTDANRAHLRQWLPWLDITKSVEDTRSFIERGAAQDDKGKGFHCGIWHEGRLVGVIGYHDLDLEKRIASIGYWLGKAAQGKGPAALSCRALIDHVFGELKMERVEIHCAVENKRSRSIPERLGLKVERMIPQAEDLYGSFVDHARYAISARDWPLVKKPK